jgi:hypothetical protein
LLHYEGASLVGCLRGLAIWAAGVTINGNSSWRAQADETTAATWRRLRNDPALPPFDETEWQDADKLQGTTDSTATVPVDAIARAFKESQHAGVAAIIGLAQAAAPPLPRTVEALPSRPEILEPRPGEIRSGIDAETTKRRVGGAASNSRRVPHLQWLYLIAILTAQAVSSLRLVWSNTAFRDEATFLSAGHLEIAHWLHGTAIPPYATYLSGAPVIYPPLGAIADSFGGLAAARLLSLFFMLGATSFLWGVTSKLFGRRAAVCATALFSILGPTLQLGAFATFDAMALFLITVSAWCMVSSRDRDDSAVSLIAGTMFLVLANATKYSTILFDPSIVALAGLAVAGKRGSKAAIARSGYIAAATIGLIDILLALGGPRYLSALLNTTISRPAGASGSMLVLADSWKWFGIVCSVACASLIVCAFRDRNRVQLLILAVLVASAALAPLNQFRIHTITSLSKNADFGAWFATAAAGYTIAQITQIGRRKTLHLVATVSILIGIAVPIGVNGRAQAAELFNEWPNSAKLTADLASLTRHYGGHYLVEDYDVPAYYMRRTVPRPRWAGTSYFSYIPRGAAKPLTGLAAYRAAINNHYFSLVILNFNDTAKTNAKIIDDMQQEGNYRVIDVVPSSVSQFTIWAYQAPQRSASRYGSN